MLLGCCMQQICHHTRGNMLNTTCCFNVAFNMLPRVCWALQVKNSNLWVGTCFNNNNNNNCHPHVRARYVKNTSYGPAKRGVAKKSARFARHWNLEPPLLISGSATENCQLVIVFINQISNQLICHAQINHYHLNFID